MGDDFALLRQAEDIGKMYYAWLGKRQGESDMSEKKTFDISDGWGVVVSKTGTFSDGGSADIEVFESEADAVVRAERRARDGYHSFIFRPVRKFVCPVDVTDVLLDHDPDENTD